MDISQKEVMKKLAEDYINKQKEESKKIKEMISNTSYIDWLNQFTKDKKSFCDDQWLYFPEKISSTDRENVEKLNLFYEGINIYAKQNHIYPTLCNFGNFYRVNLNDFGFEIGTLIGQETIFFFNKVSLKNNKNFIDFNDIMSEKKQDNVDQINAILDSLSNIVIKAYENGVPIESIIDRLDNTIKGISSKEENKTKTLIRR